ncbi:SIR2 family protein [Burkholderia seminalis]|uniref:SIR2 family protein n=1 Tax=Burkholderia seminalis TaxID=488731 RepID=UPI001CF3A96B|nr:SIR2 family protein [Burkholderia seminalis]MCA8425833.1 SIR2 family protein [Burkholderia seminalis]
MTTSSTQFSPDIQAFINAFANDIADGAAAIFAGAGLSVGSGYVNWSELMREIAEELGLDVDRESNLVAVAQYHLNERRNRTRINQKIIDEFSVGHALNENHKILARLPIATYWTTNYDRMIETALEAAGKVVDVKYTVEHLKKTQRGRQAVVYKMHGDVGEPDKAVLTKDDYEGYFRDRESFVTALTGDLVSKTMLFVGFSFTDPNIDYVMSRIRVVLRSQPKQHYCILRREARRSGEKHASFEYRRRQQDYFVKDLARIGIHALMVHEYADVTRLLQAIEARYRTRTVFISGSAHEFDPWLPDDAGRLIESLSARLISEGFTVVTGFGLGVGPSVIAGALHEILAHPKRHSQNQLQAFPFPVASGSAIARRALYRPHREAMIGKAGIAIFLFGNKRDGHGDIVPADGMRDELAIARALGLHIVAAGATGWVAQEIANDLAESLAGRTKAFRKAFAIANDPDPGIDIATTVGAILTMVKEYREL